ATVLLYSPGIDPFIENLAKASNRVFYFEEGPRDSPRQTAKTWQTMKGPADTGSILMTGLSAAVEVFIAIRSIPDCLNCRLTRRSWARYTISRSGRCVI
ncbi:MAG: hypothetical protein MUO26_01200, partial [Methanotrichaceae archaeon]|nr:hypothetical protein [Methanotrichaceae archaeon]